MTKTNAKKGMIPYKKGYSKDDIEYDFIMNVPYSENVGMRNIIEGLRADINNLQAEKITLTKGIDKLASKIDQLENIIDGQNEVIETVKTQYYEALKGVLGR